MRLLALVLLLVSAGNAAGASTWDGPRMRVGHDPAWASPAFDDSSWTKIALNDVPHPNDSVWLRWKVDLTRYERAPGRPYGVYFGAMASHEIWWDGTLIGKSGVVGRTRDTEVPGRIESHYQVPDRLVTPGVHTVAVRASAFHRGFSPRTGYWELVGGNYDAILAARSRDAHLALIALSGILLTGVFAFALYGLTRRDRSFLLLGTLCTSAAGLLVTEAWRPLFGYTYDWHIVRLVATVVLSWFTGVQLVALVVARFPHRTGPLWLAAVATACTIGPFIPRGWDPKSVLIFVVCFVFAALWTGWAALRRLYGSLLALLGCGGATVALFLFPYDWLDMGVYFALNFVFVCLLCSHALEVRREQDQKARLELEMLRMHLQPHFLMNTLTALSEWIEAEPKTAVRMIESLSEELRILGGMSSRSLVTSDEELRLCRSHLTNMGLRKDVRYELETDGIDGSRLVPPAIFHTLVENAITHGPAAAHVTLRLRERRDGARIEYVFEAPAEEDGAPSRAGGGTRYIEARLREAWGDAWSFRQERTGPLWRVSIAVPA